MDIKEIIKVLKIISGILYNMRIVGALILLGRLLYLETIPGAEVLEAISGMAILMPTPLSSECNDD